MLLAMLLETLMAMLLAVGPAGGPSKPGWQQRSVLPVPSVLLLSLPCFVESEAPAAERETSLLPELSKWMV